MDDGSELRLGTYYRMHLFRWMGFGDVDGRIIDIGGRDGRWLGTLRGHRLLVDIDPVRASDVDYARASGDALPVRNGVADHVFSLDVLEHVPDESGLIEEALRVLRPGGELLMTTPSTDIRVFPGFLQAWVDRNWGHDRVRGFDAEYLRALADKHGARDVEVQRLSLRAFRWAYFPMRLLWSAPGPLGRACARLAARIDARYPYGRRGWVLLRARR